MNCSSHWLINYCISLFTCSQTSAEAFLLPKSGGTWGHKGDAFLQCNRGYFYLWPQERSVSSSLCCLLEAGRHVLWINKQRGICVVAHCYAIHRAGSWFTSPPVIFSWTVAKLSSTAASCCLLFTLERCPLTDMKTSHIMICLYWLH